MEGGGGGGTDPNNTVTQSVEINVGVTVSIRHTYHTLQS